MQYLLLDGLDHPLVDVYAGRSSVDPAPLFLDLCRTHRSKLASLLAFRRVQTNECGRSALLGPGLTWLASRLKGPFALIDRGGSRYQLLATVQQHGGWIDWRAPTD